MQTTITSNEFEEQLIAIRKDSIDLPHVSETLVSDEASSHFFLVAQPLGVMSAHIVSGTRWEKCRVRGRIHILICPTHILDQITLAFSKIL